jgi:hypothetical protein
MSGSVDFSVGGMTVTGLAAVTGRFQGAARRLHDRLYDVMIEEGEQIAELARVRMGELFRNPSKMQASIRVQSADDIGSTSAVTEVSISATGLPYLAIHEYGGTVMTPEIFPVNARVLHFFTPGWAGFSGSSSKEAATNEVFTPHTAAHVTVIPERSYLRYALAQRRAAIREAFATAAISF